MAESVADGAMLESVPRETLSNRVYEQLRGAILSGHIADDAELNQADLAERFGVSRVPVREALLRLEAEHLVLANPFQRYTVASLTPEQVVEFTEIRAELEVLAIRRTVAALKEGTIDMRTLRAAAARLSLRDDVATWIDADREFHRLLDGQHTMTARFVDGLRSRIQRYTYIAVAHEDRRLEVMREHTAILDALEARQLAKAERLLRSHIGATRVLLEGEMQQRLPSTAGNALRKAARKPSLKAAKKVAKTRSQ